MQNKFITQIQNSLTKTGYYPETLDDSGTTLQKSVQLKKFLDSVFGKNAVEVAYDHASGFHASASHKGEWDMGCCDSVFVTSTGKVVEVSNSEWGWMTNCGTVRPKTNKKSGIKNIQEDLLKFKQGVSQIQHYLITMACQEDYTVLIGICDKLLETYEGE